MADQHNETKNHLTAGRQEHPARRPYTRPELVAYGPLAKLTRGTKSGAGELTPDGARKTGMTCL